MLSALVYSLCANLETGLAALSGRPTASALTLFDNP